MRGSCDQIEHVIYNKGLDGFKGENYAINEFATPAIEYITELIIDETFDISDLNDEEAGRLALPITLSEIAIVDVNNLPEKTAQLLEWPIGTPTEHLKIAVNNVMQNENLNGKSPQEWIGEIVWEEYRTKGDLYYSAVSDGRLTNSQSWSISLEYYKEIVDTLLREDDLTIFIQSCGAVSTKNTDLLEPIVWMTEQSMPYYSILLGRSMGRVVKLYKAPCPSGIGTIYIENFTRTRDGIYIGLWTDLKIFLKDYEDSVITPWLEERQRDGTWIYVVWIKH